MHRLLNMGNYLLAGYQTSYTHIQAAVEAIVLEAARLYLDLKSGRVASAVAGMTEMQLLWIFTQLIRYHYGYDFFKNGLMLTMFSIDEKLAHDDEARPYALFFAACALSDLEDTSGFDHMLKITCATTLPVQVSFALRCEMEASVKTFANSRAVKDFDKKLKRLLNVSAKDRLGQNARVHALFNAPISATTAKVASRPKKEKAKRGKYFKEA